jgi:hypothetical protein
LGSIADTIRKSGSLFSLLFSVEAFEELMQKIVLSILLLILAGCSAIPNLSFGPPPAAVPATPSPEPSVTRVVPKDTNTPDLFVINTAGPTSTPYTGTPPTNTVTPTSLPTSRPTITLEPIDITLFTPGPNPFVLLSKSTTQLVWGPTCDGARDIKFVVQLIQPLRRLKYVTLWYRLQDKYSGFGTDWGGGVIMLDNDRSTYFYTVQLDQIKDYEKFQDAWLQFQFVASTATRKRLGSSIVDRTSVSLSSCRIFNP